MGLLNFFTRKKDSFTPDYDVCFIHSKEHDARWNEDVAERLFCSRDRLTISIAAALSKQMRPAHKDAVLILAKGTINIRSVGRDSIPEDISAGILSIDLASMSFHLNYVVDDYPEQIKSAVALLSEFIENYHECKALLEKPSDKTYPKTDDNIESWQIAEFEKKTSIYV